MLWSENFVAGKGHWEGKGFEARILSQNPKGIQFSESECNLGVIQFLFWDYFSDSVKKVTTEIKKKRKL